MRFRFNSFLYSLFPVPRYPLNTSHYRLWSDIVKTLYQENFVCVASSARLHQTTQNSISLDDYLQAKHLLVSLREDMVGIVDDILAKKQLTRQVTVSVPNFLIVPFVLMGTDLIATLPIQIAQTLMLSWEIQSYLLPFEMSGFSVDLLWHSKNDRELGHQWLRGLIAQLCPIFCFSAKMAT